MPADEQTEDCLSLWTANHIRLGFEVHVASDWAIIGLVSSSPTVTDLCAQHLGPSRP